MKRVISISMMAALAAAGSAQLLIVDSGTVERVWSFSSQDGTFISDNVIVDDANNRLSTPIKLIDSGRGSYYISDQVNNAVLEYSYGGQYLNTIVSGESNIRGITIHNGFLYVASGSLNSILRFNADGTNRTVFSSLAQSPWDIFFKGNDILVSNSTNNSITKLDLNGVVQGQWNVTGGGATDMFFPQQIAQDGANLLIAGFSGGPPVNNVPNPLPGLFSYDLNGNQLQYISSTLGARGIARLGNGMILYASGTRVVRYDPTTQTHTDMWTGTTANSFRFITPVPEPGTLALLGGGLAFLVRRRKSR
jgi:hypothetical protein